MSGPLDNNEVIDAKFLGGYQNKSGVPTEGLDRCRIDEIIREASKGSKFYAHQQRREKRITERVAVLIERKASLEKDKSTLKRATLEYNQWLNDVEQERDLSRTFLHVDMDAFFAAVEELKRPELRGKPMAVGGESMLSTANYEARKYGVISAMPGYIARKLCPQLIIIPPDYPAYKRASETAHQIFAYYDSHFTSFSLDEASLEITQWLEISKMTSEDVIVELKRKITEQTKLTCSVGIGPNRQLAKLCSNINKPDGHFWLPDDAEQIRKFIQRQPIKRINGIGRVMNKILEDLLGIKTCADLIDQGVWIRLLFRELQSEFLLKSALGLGQAFGESLKESHQKSISVERTFSTIIDLSKMRNKLKHLCELLAADLAEHNLATRNISIKLKSSNFEVHTRAFTTEFPICSAEELFYFAEPLLVKEPPKDLRLLGVRAAALVSLSDTIPRYRKLDEFTKSLSGTVEPRPTCPICNAEINAHPEDYIRINEHVDSCLKLLSATNTTTTTTTMGSPKKPKKLSQFFRPSNTTNNNKQV